jgi:pilus assembly protein Flp/PilA
MHRIVNRPRRRGQGLVEYGLILVLIAIAVVIMLTMVGSQINNTFSRVGSALPAVP